MIIKEAIVQHCGTCKRFEKELSPEQHGCDECLKPIVPYGNDERLDVKLFYKNNLTETYFFCSWRCVFKFVKHRGPTDYFFTLPYVSSDNKLPGRTAKDFMKEINKTNVKRNKR